MGGFSNIKYYEAEAFKNRLVHYDCNAVERIVVIDDQSDYYDVEGNACSSAKYLHRTNAPRLVQQQSDPAAIWESLT